MKFLKQLKIDGIIIFFESIKLYSTEEHTEYFITAQNYLDLTLGKHKFQTVKKRTRTWIEPIVKI